jgi:hypothetical protein
LCAKLLQFYNKSYAIRGSFSIGDEIGATAQGLKGEQIELLDNWKQILIREWI